MREATYQVLRELGMTVIFGNPGSTELPFLHDMPSDFKYVLGLHERSAAGMGLGYALGGGKAAFINLHSIASTGNGLSTVVDAWHGHVPLVVTSGQQDRRHILAEPFLASRAVDKARPYVKWAYEPMRAEDVPAAVARGYYLAMQAPMGPVFLSIPMDDWTHQCELVAIREVTRSLISDAAALHKIAAALNPSRNPAIVTGAQIEEDGAWNDVIGLAEQLGADVFQQPIAPRWTFPHSHPLFRGALLPAQKPLTEQLANYDVVLVLGAPIFLYYTYVPGKAIKPGTALFQITNSPQDAAAALVGSSVVGNIAAAAQYIRAHVKPRQWRDAPTRAEALPPPAYPITPAYLFKVLNKVIPRDAVICEECPSSKGDLERYLKLDAPNSFYSVPNGVLGFGLPAAVGLQLALPKRKVVCPIGDGSIQYSIQALWSAAQQNAEILIVVLCNKDYSALKSFCDFTKVGRNAPGMDIAGIDIVKIAEGYGVAAQEVDRPEDGARPERGARFERAAPYQRQRRAGRANVHGDGSVRESARLPVKTPVRKFVGPSCR